MFERALITPLNKCAAESICSFSSKTTLSESFLEVAEKLFRIGKLV